MAHKLARGSIYLLDTRQLCVGLDIDSSHNLVKLISDVDLHADCYKANLAHYLALPDGLDLLKSIKQLTNKPLILDAKFGDIGSTCEKYAKFTYNQVKADAVTVNPYMGLASIEPFLRSDKLVYVLGRTSNQKGFDLQQNGKSWEIVVKWAGQYPNQVGIVSAATEPAIIKRVRWWTDNWILCPGVGAQGGNLRDSLDAASNKNIIITISRAIINSDEPEEAAKRFKDEIQTR